MYTSFPAIPKVGIFVLIKIQRMFVCHFGNNSKHYDKCKFDLKVIQLLPASHMFYYKLYRNVNFANFVYSESTHMESRNSDGTY